MNDSTVRQTLFPCEERNRRGQEGRREGREGGKGRREREREGRRNEKLIM